MTAYDLAIVGASFAGLTCAQAAAARGLRTIVLDRKAEPGALCHTTGILVKEVADAWDIPPRLTRRIHGVRLYSPSLQWVDLQSPGYFFLATDTPGLLRHLADSAASAGAGLRFGTSYQGASTSENAAGNGRLTLEGCDVRCRYLVGADGARSRVASDFGLGQNREFLVGAEVEMAGVRGFDDDRLHVFLDERLAPGYIAWVVPGVGVTQIGLAGRGSIAGRLDEFLRRLACQFDFADAVIVARRGGLIPCGGPVRRWSAKRVMLLGDAAGMVSPLTAGGIHPAMQLGRIAGVAIGNYLLDAGEADAGQAPHAAGDPARVVRGAAPSFFWKGMLRGAFEWLPVNFVADRALASPWFRHVAQTVFFHHRGLFSFDAWREAILGTR